MKQNDLIISIVAIVLALIIAGVCWGTKREPATIAAPEVVNLGTLQDPAATPVMASSLPSGGSTSGGPGGGGPGGFGGGAVGRGGNVAGAPAGFGAKSGGGPSAAGMAGAK